MFKKLSAGYPESKTQQQGVVFVVSTAKVSQYLEGIDFPVNKQQLIDYAQDNDAPQDVLDMLRKLPEGRYFSIAGVWEAIGKAA